MSQECPSCETKEQQIKTGRNRSGTQRILCRDCGRTYTIEPKPRGYTEEVRDYYTDGFLMYQDLSYWGRHLMLKDKSETYSVEGGNADLRHYLARLARSSRCFSRCFKALARAVELFVYFYNERQLRKKRLPKYPAYLTQNLPTLI